MPCARCVPAARPAVHHAHTSSTTWNWLSDDGEELTKPVGFGAGLVAMCLENAVGDDDCDQGPGLGRKKKKNTTAIQQSKVLESIPSFDRCVTVTRLTSDHSIWHRTAFCFPINRSRERKKKHSRFSLWVALDRSLAAQLSRRSAGKSEARPAQKKQRARVNKYRFFFFPLRLLLCVQQRLPATDLSCNFPSRP